MGDHHKKVLRNYLKSHQSKSGIGDTEGNADERSQNPNLIDKFEGLKVLKTPVKAKSKSPVSAKTPIQMQLPRKFTASRKASIDDMPDEVLLYIFGFLPANDLLTSASVCRRWLKLSNDDVLWQELYMKYGQLKKHESVEVQLKVHGDIRWKRECIRRCIEKRNSRLKLLLKKKSNYTLLPADTKKVIEKLGIRWQLVLTDSDKNEHFFDQSDVYHFQTSVTVRWYSLEFPPIKSLYQAAIYALAPLFFHKDGSAVSNSPCQRSLLLKVRLDGGFTKEQMGADERVSLHSLRGGLILGTWKDGGDLAFLSQCLHCAHLIQKCLRGSSDSIYLPLLKKPPMDDIDPQYGLHDYTCIVELRNQRAAQWSQQFRFLHTSKSDLNDGFAKLVLIRDDVMEDHSSTIKKLSLPWKTEIFKGIVQDLCIMDLTLHDEFKETMWTVSSPVAIYESDDHKVDFTYDGPAYHIKHSDDIGHVILRLIWIEDREVFMVTKGELYLSCKAINDWFSTRY
ncbi:F-box only protein 15-like [Anneissia japonica]|uniref:F-box only protein 15-like n=1 Tax=Anneissia japonica TaxID=1529436 RepID=UPI001425B359|nr:F-box only protein 15-like [Anneissia japonica]XP_033117240.1 F-box only protein 15-like [Anneissia japonica]XP_033117241.1 F-box only protein 15-like [Anneissia japonica]